MIIGESDGQFHEDLRRALNPLFTPARSRAYQPFMQRAADWFLDQYIASGSIDFIDEFIAPVTALTTVHVLGLPTSAWADSVDVFHGLMAFTPGSERYERALNEQGPALMSVFMDVAKERRKVPRDDVISTIASLTVDGRFLNDEELSLVIFNLVSGGVDTTTGFTGMSLRHLDQDRETRAKLIEDRQLIEPATEELLRLYGSVQCLSRTVTADIEVGGQTMRRGDRALIIHAAANRDPAEFKEPDQFDLDRTRNRHLSFGLSSHRCLGAHIARIVFQTMLTTILTRIPDYSIVHDRVVQTKVIPSSSASCPCRPSSPPDQLPASLLPSIDHEGGEVSDEVELDVARCQGHARCLPLAPSLFDIDDDGFGRVLIDGEVGTSDRSRENRRPSTVRKERSRSSSSTVGCPPQSTRGPWGRKITGYQR